MRTVRIGILISAISAATCFGQAANASNAILQANAANISLLEIRTPDNLACNIDVVSRPQDMVQVTYEKTAKANSEETRQRFMNLIDVVLDDNAQEAGALRLRILTPTEAPWEGTSNSAGIDVFIAVPENFKIDSKNSFSKINLTGPLSQVWVSNEYGEVTAQDIDGEINIRTSYANVDLNNIKGDINIETSYSRIKAKNIDIGNNPGLFETSYGIIELTDVKGPIEANTSYEAIIVRNIDAGEGSVILRTSYGRINADNIKGELVCETSYNPVELTNINFTHGMNKVETRYSQINLDLAGISDAQLIVNNTYNNIDVTLPRDISARLALAVDKGGKIHTRGFAIKPLVMEKNRLEGLIGDGRARLELNIDGIGEISIEGK